MLTCAGTEAGTTAPAEQTRPRPPLLWWWTRSRRTLQRPRRRRYKLAAVVLDPYHLHTTQRRPAATTWRTARRQRRPAPRLRRQRPRPRTVVTWKCPRLQPPRQAVPTTWWPAFPVPRLPYLQVWTVSGYLHYMVYLFYQQSVRRNHNYKVWR